MHSPVFNWEKDMKKKKTVGNSWIAFKDTDTLKPITTTQDLIPINSVRRNGTFEIEENNGKAHLYDRVYKFSDINYTTKDNNEKNVILIKYCSVLNSLSVRFKIIIANLTRDKAELDEIHIRKAKQSDVEKEFANIYNNLINDKLSNSSTYIDQNRYLVVTTNKKTYEEADTYFDQIEMSIMNQFEAFGSELIQIDGLERLNVLYRAFRVDPEIKYADNWGELVEDEFKDTLAAVNVKANDTNGIQYMKIDDKYVCTLTIRKNGYPTQLSNEFMKQLMSLGYSSLITLDVTPIPKDILVETLTKKLDSVEMKISKQQEIRNKNEQYSSDITRNVKIEKKNIEDYLDEVTENDQRMFFSQLLVTVYADSEEQLKSRIENIQQLGRSVVVDIGPYYLQQYEAFMTALPTGARAVNTMMRALFTNALVAFAPFNVQEIYDAKGRYYGINLLSRKLIVGDRRKLINGNGWIFGVPGSGKSFLGKLEIGQIISGTNDIVFLLDPQNEDESMVKIFGGEYINVSANSNNHINPFEIDNLAAKKNVHSYIDVKSEFALDIICQIVGRELALGEKSCIDKAIRTMYFDIFKSPEEDWKSPTFKTFRNYLYNIESDIDSDVNAETAKNLAEGLYVFTEGSLNLFAHPQNVKLNNRFIAFGIKELGKQLTPLAMLIVLETIRNRLSFNQSRGYLTHVYVDEAHVFTDYVYTAEALNRYYKEVRKQGGFMTGITQNVSDLLFNKTTKNMIANSEFIAMLTQSEADIPELMKIVNISQNERKYLLTRNPGTGLLKFGKTLVPINSFVDKDKYKKMYELFNTNLHEKIAAGEFEKDEIE